MKIVSVPKILDNVRMDGLKGVLGDVVQKNAPKFEVCKPATTLRGNVFSMEDALKLAGCKLDVDA